MAVWERKDGYHVKIAPKGQVLITVRKPDDKFSFLTIFEGKVTESAICHSEQNAMYIADLTYDPPSVPLKAVPTWPIGLGLDGKKFATWYDPGALWWFSEGFSWWNKGSGEEPEDHARE